MTEIHRMETLEGYEPEIGRWLWALQAVRTRTLDSVAGLGQQTLDWEGPGGSENSIGSLLYHIAYVELSWLFDDIFLQDFPAPLKTEFPIGIEMNGRLSRMPLIPLDKHLDRLARSRQTLLDKLRGMSLEDWNRLRSPADQSYEVTPAWAVFHLIEHEAAHTAQILGLKHRAARFFAA